MGRNRWLGAPWLRAVATPVCPRGREPREHGLTCILILSLLSPSSTPISGAPAHGEFESVRAQPPPRALVGGDGGRESPE